MKRYQIVKRPIATATGERGTWSFVAHGARYEKKEADEMRALLETNGYQSRLLPI